MLLGPDPDPHSRSGSGSRSIEINVDPCGSGATTLHVRTTSKPIGDAPLEDRVLRDALKELQHQGSSLADVPNAGVQIIWKSCRSCKLCYSSQNRTDPDATLENGPDPDPTKKRCIRKLRSFYLRKSICTDVSYKNSCFNTHFSENVGTILGSLHMFIFSINKLSGFRSFPKTPNVESHNLITGD